MQRGTKTKNARRHILEILLSRKQKKMSHGASLANIGWHLLTTKRQFIKSKSEKDTSSPESEQLSSLSSNPSSSSSLSSSMGFWTKICLKWMIRVKTPGTGKSDFPAYLLCVALFFNNADILVSRVFFWLFQMVRSSWKHYTCIIVKVV